jgi:hypothetical protein
MDMQLGSQRQQRWTGDPSFKTSKPFDMLLSFVKKYDEWECTTENGYADLLAQNPAGRASGTPQK